MNIIFHRHDSSLLRCLVAGSDIHVKTPSRKCRGQHFDDAITVVLTDAAEYDSRPAAIGFGKLTGTVFDTFVQAAVPDDLFKQPDVVTAMEPLSPRHMIFAFPEIV